MTPPSQCPSIDAVDEDAGMMLVRDADAKDMLATGGSQVFKPLRWT